MTKWSEMFDGQLDLAAAISDEQTKAVPARRGVFLLTTQDDTPIVLLTAADIRLRVRNRIRQASGEQQRTRTANLREVTGRIYWKLSTSHFETDLHFLDIAQRIWPADYPSLLAWKLPWFVHLDSEEAFPHLARTTDVLARSGLYLGPFTGGSPADRFIEAIQDAFSLCRDDQRLCRAPHGQVCAYAQMGKCLRVCDGTISMDQYRQIVRQAASFAAGDRAPYLEELQSRMKQAAASLDFEQAAAIKVKIDRLSELDRDRYSTVAPVSDFRFIVAQSRSAKKVRVFLVNGGQIVEHGVIAFPPAAGQLDGVIAKMSVANWDRTSATPQDRYRRYRIGLVAHYLLSSPRKMGLFLRWHAALTAGQLGEAIAAAADVLGLKLSPPSASSGEDSLQ